MKKEKKDSKRWVLLALLVLILLILLGLCSRNRNEPASVGPTQAPEQAVTVAGPTEGLTISEPTGLSTAEPTDFDSVKFKQSWAKYQPLRKFNHQLTKSRKTPLKIRRLKNIDRCNWGKALKEVCPFWKGKRLRSIAPR